MPPAKRAKRTSRTAAINTNYSSDDSEDSDTNLKRKRSAKNRLCRPPVPPPEYSDDAVTDNDIYDDDNRTYIKIANEVVKKNVNLPALFDPHILPGFKSIIDKTSKVSAASRVFEASFKVYGKRVDVVHTEARKLDHDVITRNVEKNEIKKKNHDDEDDEEEESGLNESFKWGGEDNTVASFSEDDEESIIAKKQRQNEASMSADMTMTSFGSDESNSFASAMASNSDSFFNDDDPRKMLLAFSKNRTVIMGDQKRSAEEIEKRLKTANDAAIQYYKNEMLRRGINKGSRKEGNAEAETTKEDYSQFHNKYFKYALNKKREKRHICFDDVAATTMNYSRIYMHNEWCDEDDGMLQSQEDKNGPDDGSFLYYPKSDTQEDKEEEVEKDIDDVDILDGVLEQFQGTFELATSASHKLEDEWIEMLGLERRDLRPSNNTNISFEQTANDNFDLEKRLVDRLIIDGEDEAMKAEENRIEKIVKTIFSERIQLPGGPGNINENSLHRQINSPPSVEIYQNEDIFFPFDQSKYITTESIDAQIALSRSYFIKNTNIKNAKSYGIFEKLFEALKSCNSPVIPLPDEIIQIVETLPNYSYIKCLFAADTVSKFDSFRTSETLSSSLTPFRIARYSEHLSNSVIHEVQSCNLKSEFFDRSVNFSQSTFLRSFPNYAPSPSKRPRFDETLINGEGYRYFAAVDANVEHEKILRYPEQFFNEETSVNQICNIVSQVLSAEKGVSVFLKERITKHFSPESIHTLLAFLKFYEDYRGKDISNFPCYVELPEDIQKDLEELSAVEEILGEHENLSHDETATTTAAAASMETDHDFNHDFDFDETATDFYDALSSFDQTLAVEESQVIFTNANSNDTTTATMEIDHVVENNDDSARENNFNATFFENVRHEEAAEESDDSLAEIVGNFEVPKKPATKTSTRPKRTVKKIEFVFDDSHWETAADKRARKKKPIVREELENHFNDDLLFAPRKTFENVTISRRRENSPLSLISLLLRQSPRIPRCQDSSLPDIICNKFLYRLELGQTIPGYADHDKLFMCTRLNEYMRRSFQQNAVLYRGKYSFLPSISTTRQRDNFAFWLKTFRLCSNLSDAAASTINDTETNDSENNCDGLSNDDAIDHDFDAPSSPPPQMQSKNAGQFKDSFMRQYKPYFDEDGDDEEEEFDDFDFESRIDKMAALESFDGKFALKRAIKYILTKPQYDRSTLPDEISGIKAPSPKIAEDLPTSTPLLQKKQSRFEFISEDDEIIASENHQNDMDVNEDVEESDFENDSDETRMKNFEVDGFHTMKSLLYYLPQFCYPDTVRVLSVAYVFCTLCHMANENSLNLIQELVQLDGSTEATSDCRIMNLENAESEGNENDSDEENSSSPLFEISDSAEL